MRHPAHHKHQIHRTIAHYLIGNIHFATARVARLRHRQLHHLVGHLRRLHPHRARRLVAGHLRDESVAPPVSRFDILRRACPVVQRLAHLRHLHRKRMIVHKRVAPNGLQQGIPLHHLARMLHQIKQHFESLWG